MIDDGAAAWNCVYEDTYLMKKKRTKALSIWTPENAVQSP